MLEDPIVRVPTEAEPSGIAYMSGFSIDQQVKLMVNQSDLNRDNLALVSGGAGRWWWWWCVWCVVGG